MSKNQAEKIQPVKKRIKVSLQKEVAFQLFTEGMSKWWPLATHSVGEEMAETCIFEAHAGGRIYEIMKDGRQVEWGKVMSWEPFEKVVFDWHPGRSPETAQVVTVSFSEIPGGTLVELVQTGWETRGAEAQAKRDGYDLGWEYVLANFVIQAAS